MKKSIAITLSLILALALCACGNNGGAASAFEGTSSEALKQVTEGADYEAEMMLGEEPLSKDNCEGTVGISADVLEANVEEGTLSYAMISSVAHLTAMIKCKDANAAAAVKEAIEGGFNMQRWVCVTPETAFVADSGAYVFFVASFADYAEALYTSFSTIAGDTLGTRTDITD